MIYIDAPIRHVYKSIAIADQIEIWFLKRAEYRDDELKIRPGNEAAQKGDRYTWTWHIYTGTEHGEVLEANGKDHFSFTFANSVVDIKLEKSMGMTLLVLEQKDIDQDEDSKLTIYNGCSNGWTFWLTNLKAWLEHKILLHEKNTELFKLESNHSFING